MGDKGRPPLVSGKRIKKIDVRFSLEEFALVLEMEKSTGMSKADLIRNKLLTGGRRSVLDSRDLMKELDKIGLELSRAGNNINQLARYANILHRDALLSPVVVDRLLLELKSYHKIRRDLDALFRKLLRLLGS